MEGETGRTRCQVGVGGYSQQQVAVEASVCSGSWRFSADCRRFWQRAKIVSQSSSLFTPDVRFNEDRETQEKQTAVIKT